MEFKEGQVYKRLKGPNITFTVGRKYPVRIDENGVPFIESDGGAPWYSGEIIDDRFELVQDNKGDNEMEYKFKEGQVYEYTGESVAGFKHGQLLTVKTNGDIGYVVSNSGTRWYEDDFTGNELKLVTEPLTEKNATKHEEEGNMVNPDSTFTPKPVLINVEDLLHDIDEHDYTLIQLKAYLTGYLKGGRF